MWGKFEFATVSAVAFTLLFVIIGQSAEQLAGNGGAGVLRGDNSKAPFNAIDYASTGSSTKTPVVIGPCATRQP